MERDFRGHAHRIFLDYMGRIILSFVTLAAGLEVPYFEMKKMVYSFLEGKARWGMRKLWIQGWGGQEIRFLVG